MTIDKFQQIIDVKREEMKLLTDNFDLTKAPKRPSFIDSVKRKNNMNVIAEFKRYSPSNPNINKEADLLTQVKEYQNRGANALSILTDKRFGGSVDDLRQVCEISPLPLLAKDFILQKNQISQAKLAGASAVLLIVKAFLEDQSTLKELYEYATSIGLDSIVEINDLEELDIAIKIDSKIIAVNSRNLRTFVVNTQIFLDVLPNIPNGIVRIAASGILAKEDILPIKDIADCILVGTSVMQNPNLLNDIKNETKN